MNALAENDAPEIIMADVVDVVGAHYGVSRTALRSMRRTPELIEPRHIAFYVGAKVTGLSLPQIGAFMARDHTSILHGRDKIAQAIRKDRDLAERVSAIEIAAATMSQIRRNQMITQYAPVSTPLELARMISERGARAACGASVNQILDLCDALIEASKPPPSPTTRYLIADLVTRQNFFRARPNESNRMARDEAVELLREPWRQSDAFVADIITAFDFMNKNEFTLAEKEATQKFNDVVRRATNWLEQYGKKSGDHE